MSTWTSVTKQGLKLMAEAGVYDYPFSINRVLIFGIKSGASTEKTTILNAIESQATHPDQMVFDSEWSDTNLLTRYLIDDEGEVYAGLNPQNDVVYSFRLDDKAGSFNFDVVIYGFKANKNTEPKLYKLYGEGIVPVIACYTAKINKVPAGDFMHSAVLVRRLINENATTINVTLPAKTWQLDFNKEIRKLEREKEDKSQKAQAGGYASLDANGYVPSSQYNPSKIEFRERRGQPLGYAGLNSSGELEQNIDASKITSGLLAPERIPNLNASKITSGLLAPERGGVPTGSIFWFAKKDTPNGFLYCNGADISKTTYSALYAVIGNEFGNAYNNDKFRLPDLRERFIRGYGESTSYASRFGAYQNSALQAHRHYIARSGERVTSSFNPLSRYNYLWNYYNQNGTSTYTNDYALHGQGLVPDVGGTSMGHAANFAPTETRPKNITLLPCIKY